jgi:hypothetical protein
MYGTDVITIVRRMAKHKSVLRFAAKHFQKCFELGACRNSILGIFGTFLAKISFQNSKFSKGIFLTWPLFSHFVINLDRLAGQPI